MKIEEGTRYITSADVWVINFSKLSWTVSNLKFDFGALWTRLILSMNFPILDYFIVQFDKNDIFVMKCNLWQVKGSMKRIPENI